MSGLTEFIRRRPLLSTLLGAAVVIGGVGAVSAQYYGGPGSWGRGGPGGWGRGGGIERFCSVPHARFQPVMRAYIKADLNMTGAQSAEFDKLADVLAPAFDEIKTDLCASFKGDAPKITPPEKLEKIAVALRKAAVAAENAVAPAKSLYSQLDDTQKAEIDRRMERNRGRAREGRGGYGEGQGWRERRHEDRGGWRERGDHRGMGERGMGQRRDGYGGGDRGQGQQPGYGQAPDGPGGPFFRGGQQ